MLLDFFSRGLTSLGRFGHIPSLRAQLIELKQDRGLFLALTRKIAACLENCPLPPDKDSRIYREGQMQTAKRYTYATKFWSGCGLQSLHGLHGLPVKSPYFEGSSNVLEGTEAILCVFMFLLMIFV